MITEDSHITGKPERRLIERPTRFYEHPGLRTVTNYSIAAALNRIAHYRYPTAPKLLVDIGSKWSQIADLMDSMNIAGDLHAYRPNKHSVDLAYARQNLTEE